MPRAFVTGAAGFIGSHLAEELLRHSWQVTGMDVRGAMSAPPAAELAVLASRPPPTPLVTSHTWPESTTRYPNGKESRHEHR